MYIKLSELEKEIRKAQKKAIKYNYAKTLIVEAEKNQRPVKSITISIEWRKSRMWGSNPHARVEVEYKKDSDEYGHGRFEQADGFTASGYGYDKESTVVAKIFNMFLKYKLHQELTIMNKPYGVSVGNFRGFPSHYFEGGVGMSCYPRISEWIGGSLEHVASGKTFDVWKYTDND